MSWLSDIGEYIQTAGCGILGTDIFYHYFDELTQNCILLIDQPGQVEENTATDDLSIRRPELGVRIKNTSGELAMNKAEFIYKLLNEVVNSTIGSTYFISIKALADPFYVSQSQNNLTIYSINFAIEMEGI